MLFPLEEGFGEPWFPIAQSRSLTFGFGWFGVAPSAAFCAFLEPVAATVDGNDLGVVEKAIKDGACSRDVAQEFAPLFDGAVGGHHGGAVFVSAHDDFQKDFAAFGRQDFKSHVVDNEQVGLEIFVEQAALPGVAFLGKHLAD